MLIGITLRLGNRSHCFSNSKNERTFCSISRMFGKKGLNLIGINQPSLDEGKDFIQLTENYLIIDKNMLIIDVHTC